MFKAGGWPAALHLRSSRWRCGAGSHALHQAALWTLAGAASPCPPPALQQVALWGLPPLPSTCTPAGSAVDFGWGCLYAGTHGEPKRGRTGDVSTWKVERACFMVPVPPRSREEEGGENPSPFSSASFLNYPGTVAFGVEKNFRDLIPDRTNRVHSLISEYSPPPGAEVLGFGFSFRGIFPLLLGPRQAGEKVGSQRG